MFNSGICYNTTVTMVTEECCKCGVVFGMPSDLQEQLKRDSNKMFYCPNGHSQHYTETIEQKLRKQIQEKENALSRMHIDKIQLESQLDKANKKMKRTENRISKGVCTCCNRTFKNLAEHMKTKHPDKIK